MNAWLWVQCVHAWLSRGQKRVPYLLELELLKEVSCKWGKLSLRPKPWALSSPEKMLEYASLPVITWVLVTHSFKLTWVVSNQVSLPRRQLKPVAFDILRCLLIIQNFSWDWWVRSLRQEFHWLSQAAVVAATAAATHTFNPSTWLDFLSLGQSGLQFCLQREFRDSQGYKKKLLSTNEQTRKDFHRPGARVLAQW